MRERIGTDGSHPNLVHNSSKITPLILSQTALHKILSELRPDSVLDIGSNAGWYSKLAAFLGSKVVSFDPTPTYITQLYFDARDKNLPILPLIMHFTDPTPSRGLSSHSSIAAAERFRCDMVLALSLVPDVVFKRNLRFDQVVERLALFSKRWLVVEFIPRQDPEVAQCRIDFLGIRLIILLPR